MKAKIQTELSRIETERGVQVLYAVESGSRAWGFAATDRSRSRSDRPRLCSQLGTRDFRYRLIQPQSDRNLNYREGMLPISKKINLSGRKATFHI